MSQLKLGFVGLGIMGAPMAGHLVAAGHTVYVNTRSKVPEAIAKSAAIQCASPAEVAEKADIIFTMVPDTPDVERVLFGDKGIASGLANGGKGKVVVDMSSISPIATKEFAKKINALGADYLDAPVSGGEVGAKAGSLTIMVGGDEAVFERSIEQSRGRPAWVFYEGPPTANGTPGTHHVEARVFKDVFPRYRTMKGYYVPRIAGWDCHGLPVELAVEKELGFSGKKDIEAYGIAVVARHEEGSGFVG